MAQDAAGDTAQGTPVSPFLAFALSVVAGVGHLYLRLPNKGIFLMALFGLALSLGDGFFPALVVFYAAFDAMHTARSINDGRRPDDMDFSQLVKAELPRNWGTAALGGALIFAGVVFLLRNLGFYLPVELLWPLMPIALGIWLLAGYFRSNGQS